MVEDMVGHAPPLGNAFALVEAPVNAEIDPALAVFFLGLRQRFETPRRQRPDVSVIVERHAVELVGDERERNRVRAEEVTQALEELSSECRVC